jgi:hypothetical protein
VPPEHLPPCFHKLRRLCRINCADRLTCQTNLRKIGPTVSTEVSEVPGAITNTGGVRRDSRSTGNPSERMIF